MRISLPNDRDGLGIGIHFRLAEFGADGEDNIALRQFIPARLHAEIAGESELVAFRQDALAIDGREHRRIQSLGERADFRAASAAPPPATIRGGLALSEQAAASRYGLHRVRGATAAARFSLGRPSVRR